MIKTSMLFAGFVALLFSRGHPDALFCFVLSFSLFFSLFLQKTSVFCAGFFVLTQYTTLYISYIMFFYSFYLFICLGGGC